MAKHAYLVCQHLENISRGALEKYQDVIRQYVRNRQGVYALYRRDKLYYVGLARNLRMRLAHHLRDRHGESWDRFSVYLTIGDSHLRELESLILCIVKPKGNKQKGKFPKSEDLKRKFGKDVRVRHQQEYDEIIGKTRLVARSQSKQIPSNGRLPVLARYIDGQPMRLRARYKGQVLRARVRRDGKIRFDGKIYSSPSVAGASVCKHACNGWKFWQYERAPGDWVLLEKLRK